MYSGGIWRINALMRSPAYPYSPPSHMDLEKLLALRVEIRFIVYLPNVYATQNFIRDAAK